MSATVTDAYRAVQALTGSEYLEPLSHAERVNDLRQQFRPPKIKLLIIGESHVRGNNGPRFIYDPAYYTPWWRDLLWPAFGGRDRSRLHNLENLRDRGVWLLDMSVIALSGYRNIKPEWPARPFDRLSSQIFAASWEHFVRREFESAGDAHVVYFERAAALLPEQTRRNGIALRFNGPRRAGTLQYHDPRYLFGTARFIQAVHDAGL